MRPEQAVAVTAAILVGVLAPGMVSSSLALDEDRSSLGWTVGVIADKRFWSDDSTQLAVVVTGVGDSSYPLRCELGELSRCKMVSPRVQQGMVVGGAWFGSLTVSVPPGDVGSCMLKIRVDEGDGVLAEIEIQIALGRERGAIKTELLRRELVLRASRFRVTPLGLIPIHGPERVSASRLELEGTLPRVNLPVVEEGVAVDVEHSTERVSSTEIAAGRTMSASTVVDVLVDRDGTALRLRPLQAEGGYDALKAMELLRGATFTPTKLAGRTYADWVRLRFSRRATEAKVEEP